MHYHSPFALTLAGSFFFLIKKIKISEKNIFSKIAILLAPSMFSVYLLHNNAMGMAWLQYFEDRYIPRGEGYYMICFIVAGTFFCVGVLLDSIRRFTIFLFAHFANSFKVKYIL